ncbi:hypothetical protein IAR55_004856 [Kwoniella newhampshirensis]|uniref:NF-kappa-B-activating protein C-terminal domain-containing protein n=1 Tax=Kwoniella newhampshirensis TaxID=1651941 RepID=A0AAW0YI58_9TREE
MATVHPSRLGLVPGGAARPPPPPPVASSREDELRRKLSERKKESSGRDRDRSPESRREREGSASSRDGLRRDRDGPRDRDGEAFRDYDSRRDERDRRGGGARHDSPPHRRRDDRDFPPRERERERERRASPSYIPFGSAGGPAPGPAYGYGRRDDMPQPPRNGGVGPGDVPPPWRGNPSGGGGGWQNPPPHRGFNGTMDFERRRQEREQNTLSVWPPSPKRPYQDEDEIAAERKKNKSKSKKSKSKSKHRSSKHRSKKYYSDESSSSETDSEEEERRRRRRKEKERERRKRHDSISDSEEEERRRKRRKSKSRARSEEEDDRDVNDQWVEKGGEVVLVPTEKDREKVEKHKTPAPPVEKVHVVSYDDDDDEEVGPHLPREREDRMDRSAFTHMRPGEGEAMAAYAESGQRIPRRGEIGLDSDRIAQFEQSGYVMSGSRHQRMNAVRMRKENQVINEAEKRAILKLQREEKEKKEGLIISQFKEMMDENLRKQGIRKE